MNSGSCSQMRSSCKCPIGTFHFIISIPGLLWRAYFGMVQLAPVGIFNFFRKLGGGGGGGARKQQSKTKHPIGTAKITNLPLLESAYIIVILVIAI